MRRNESQRTGDKNVIGDGADLEDVVTCRALLDKAVTENGTLTGANFAKMANSGKQ